MRIKITGTNLGTSPALIEHAESRVRSALERFGRHVKRVTVRFTDINGGRGGEDKVCSLSVTLHRLGTTEVESMGSDAYGVVERASAKMKLVLSRKLERHQERRLSLRSRLARFWATPRPT
jgi:ribosome-associated translation inhibitor RaiA